MNFIDFFVATYEEVLTRRVPGDSESTRGRPRNQRIPYLDEHPKAGTVVRVLRSNGHRNLPNIIGPWFERNDNPDTYNLYCASVLACLQPWRTLRELKGSYSSWPAALETFQKTAGYRQKSIQANMQYYYQCRDAADRARDNEQDVPGSVKAGLDDTDMQELINGIELPDALLTPGKRAQLDHADRAVDAGFRLGIFSRDDETHAKILRNSISVAGSDRYEQILTWSNELHDRDDPHSDGLHPVDIKQGDVIALDTTAGQGSPEATVEYTNELRPVETAEPDVSMLSDEQLRAYNIFRDHFLKQKNNENVTQLLMHIQGEGGTGKSRVIDISKKIQ
jgi:hypothetical protein